MSWNGGRSTIITVRGTLTDPNTALAGPMLELPFAGFRASIAAFNKERALSRFFGDIVSTIEVGDDYKRRRWTGRKEGAEAW